MSSAPALTVLHDALAALRAGGMDAHAFCRTWRAESARMGALPPRYGQVMEDLLSRLEAGSLFSEESCSFSQHDLYAGLETWLEKARQTLGTSASSNEP